MDTFEMNGYFPANRSAINLQPASPDYARLVQLQAESRLLNTQAQIEYQFLKSRLFSGITEINKLIDLDDQIIVEEYKLCSSFRYRKQIFVMEFRQISPDIGTCNHSLELIFTGANNGSNMLGRITLVLARQQNQFIWRQLYENVIGPTGTSKVLASLILRWLQNDTAF
jgi:hypothetical protein